MEMSMALQLASFAGALLILAAYAGQQFAWMDPRRPWYNVLNGIGSAILAYVAFFPFRIGFVILEIAWTLISVFSLMRAFRGGRS
jgi:hypothetical protein